MWHIVVWLLTRRRYGVPQTLPPPLASRVVMGSVASQIAPQQYGIP